MQLTIPQIADVLLHEGCPKHRLVEWVAICLGESSGSTDAVSPDGAIGLWQIMPFNAGPNGVTVAQLYNAYSNGHVAMRMSGMGGNCAPWDSAYRNILISGRYSFLAFPEPGSADYNLIPHVAAVLGVSPPVPPPDGGSPPGTYHPSLPHTAAAWTAAGHVLTQWSDEYFKSMVLLTDRAHRLGGQFYPSHTQPLGG